MRFVRLMCGLFCVAGAIDLSSSTVSAQEEPWDTFADVLSDIECDVINAGNAELVVLTSTGQFVVVSGSDVILEDTFVDFDGNVFFAGFDDPVGFIDFAVDGDGFRSLWWTSLLGRVFDLDDFTAEPIATDLFPSDFFDVPCDACLFWDDPTVCAAPPDSPEPTISIDICGSGIPITIGMIFSTLMLLRFSRSRSRPR